MERKYMSPDWAETRTIGQIDYVQDGVLHVGAEARAVLVTAESDLSQLTGYAPGSVAFTAGMDKIWQLAADGTWAAII